MFEKIKQKMMLKSIAKYNPNTDHLKNGYFEIETAKPKFQSSEDIWAHAHIGA